jgi:hypothetical protein
MGVNGGRQFISPEDLDILLEHNDLQDRGRMMEEDAEG